MLSLSDRIRAEAAERLAQPEGAEPDIDQARLKRYLKWQSHRLRIMHRGGAGGREVCRARALVIDLLLTSIFNTVCRRFRDAPAKSLPRLALVAVGGYGRGELNPCSDLDILILHNGDSIMTHRGKPAPLLEAMTGPGGLLYTLFDLALPIGHSTRNIEDCVRGANSDMLSKTAFLEARYITGDEPLFRQMQAVLIARCMRGQEAEYIAARLTDQAARRAKHGNSSCMQEPNIKNGCGGLRDYQNLLWMASFKYRTPSVAAIAKLKVLSAAEARQLDAAYDFLLRVRNEMHFHLDRPADVLTRAIQPAIATGLGYSDRSIVRRIERFMRDLYLHMRNIHLLTRTAERRLALLPQPERRLPSLKQLWIRSRNRVTQEALDGFVFVAGEILPSHARIFRDQPPRLMRAFLYAQQRGLELHPDLAQMIRQQLRLVDRAFLRDPHARSTFLEILSQRGNVAPTLRAMHEVGFLGKYIPEFGRLTALVQHEFFHQYTADEHTLVCIAKLDELWTPKKPSHESYAKLFREIERPVVLYLALLLHDCGKSCDSGDHSDTGAELATRAARRLDLDGATTHSLRLLVENHLLMAQVSQRRDLDDPHVIAGFAAEIQNAQQLAMLTLLTVADSLGTSDQLWNGFKDSLLWTLHHKARHQLAGTPDSSLAEVRQRELLADEVRRLLSPECSEDELRAHFHELPPRYFQAHSATEIAADIALVHQFIELQLSLDGVGLEPIVRWTHQPDRGCAEIKICTWDRTRLFSKIAAALTAAGLNILTAQIFTRGDGIILDSFHVIDARTGKLPDQETQNRFELTLARMLTDSYDPAPAIARQTRAKPLYQSLESEPLPTVIRFDNKSSRDRTVVDIETQDRVGLLHAISQAFADAGVELSVAKICTEKGAAADTFYVHQPAGGRIEDAAALRDIEASLRRAIADLH